MKLYYFALLTVALSPIMLDSPLAKLASITAIIIGLLTLALTPKPR